MRDDRPAWLQKAVNKEITLNGLELLMSQRHELYKQTFKGTEA